MSEMQRMHAPRRLARRVRVCVMIARPVSACLRASRFRFRLRIAKAFLNGFAVAGENAASAT